MHQGEVGGRVRGLIEQLEPARTQVEIAREVELTPDALSRALSGQRAFSALELARLAELLDADIHWLITGQPDPRRLVVAARHDFDFDSGRRQVPGRSGDQSVLDDIGLAYHQAYRGEPPEVVRSLPEDIAKTRAALGSGFVRPFIDRLEDVLGVDVVRVRELSTSYCFTIAQRHVIAVVATGNWFRENWSLAHELAHLVKGHLDAEQRADHEAEANAFAAELLLPAETLRSLDWSRVTAAEVAERVWEFGVSTDALARRLSWLDIQVSAEVFALLEQATQRLLRHHWVGRKSGSNDEITLRMDSAATRRFPVSLQHAHLEKIASGALGKGTLAWMLGIAADELEVEAPDESARIDSDTLSVELGL
jgi:Zn-dependent peptidase ImmA (M78 family)